jgi:hypothetical protein
VGCGAAASLRESEKYLEEAAVMTKPSPKAKLLLYIATTDTTVSAVLVEEQMKADTLKQFPIYYISEALSGCDGKEEASALFPEPQYIGPHNFPSS